MLIFDKDLKALPATGHRKPGVTFSVTLQGTGSFAGSPSEDPWGPSAQISSPNLDAPPVES